MSQAANEIGIIELTQLTDKEFKLISQLVYDKFGIILGEQKRSLIIGRLNKILRQNGFTSFEQYYDYVQRDSTGHALNGLIDRISTNHTFFWRENDHFAYFSQTALPAMIKSLKENNERDLRIWCAGCSSGEEPYTLAMLIMEYLGRDLGFWDIGILATDISSKVLEIAKAGIYSDENVSHMPKILQDKYFNQLSDNSWKVHEKLQQLVLYRRLNLMREEYPFRKKFHAIFCRNVMIYFDKPTRDTLLQHFSRHSEDSAYLFIGHSESLGRSNAHFNYVKPAVYRKGQ